MPKRSARLVLSYVVAVVFPLVALAGVFHAGRNLKAPMHAGGDWKLETAPICGASSFTVSQTGTMLSITLAGHTAEGTIDGDAVRIRVSRPPCVFTAVARLDRRSHPHVIAGELNANLCETCPAAPFRAVRRNDDGRSR